MLSPKKAKEEAAAAAAACTVGDETLQTQARKSKLSTTVRLNFSLSTAGPLIPEGDTRVTRVLGWAGWGWTTWRNKDRSQSPP